VHDEDVPGTITDRRKRIGNATRICKARPPKVRQDVVVCAVFETPTSDDGVAGLGMQHHRL